MHEVYLPLSRGVFTIVRESYFVASSLLGCRGLNKRAIGCEYGPSSSHPMKLILAKQSRFLDYSASAFAT